MENVILFVVAVYLVIECYLTAKEQKKTNIEIAELKLEIRVLEEENENLNDELNGSSAYEEVYD